MRTFGHGSPNEITLSFSSTHFFDPLCNEDTQLSHRYITNVPQTRGWERKIAEGPPCVVLASPGFVQSGPSRELLELWAPDSRNGIIVTGYSVEGTMARVSTSFKGYGFYERSISVSWRACCTYHKKSMPFVSPLHRVMSAQAFVLPLFALHSFFEKPELIRSISSIC